jgi:hypothetical protein
MLEGWRLADEKTEITVTDMFGKNVYLKQVNESNSPIVVNLDDKAAGIYFVSLRNSKHNSLQKVVIGSKPVQPFPSTLIRVR